MKKLILLICIFISTIAFSQYADKGLNNDAPQILEQALFDYEFGFDIGLNGTIGENDMAGVIFVNNQFWISEWDSSTLHILNRDGELVESFAIPGVFGTRSLTTDGINIFIGTAQDEIFIIDPVTRLSTGQIDITTTSSASARMTAYDPTLDGGNGGFWIGSFTSDIASIDMNGNELSVMPSADHGTQIYGGAVDLVTDGGPYLWIHDQSGVEPEQDFITQIDLTTGLPTGLVFNFQSIATNFNTFDFVAGGLFITDQVTNGTTSLVGVCQCSPSNILFSVTLDGEVLGTDDSLLANFSMYPNPTQTGLVELKTSANAHINVSVYDILGKNVLSAEVNDSLLDVRSLTSGVYIVQVTQDGSTAQKKLIIGR